MASMIAFAGVLYVTSYKDFYYDEWDFVVGRRLWAPQAFVAPELYHLAAIPILIYKLLFLFVGLRTHVPYQAMLLLAHVAVALQLFAFIRRQSGDLLAFAASLILLFFGSGSYDIVFAFELTFVGAIAFSLAAILLSRDTSHVVARIVAIALALIGGLMCHVLTFAFIGAMFIELALDPRRRALLLGLVPPVIAFVAWYLIFDTGSYPGSSGVTTELLRGPTGFALVAGLVAFVMVGAEATAAGMFGLPANTGSAALAIVAVLVVWSLYQRRRLESWQLGMVAGLVGFFVLTGLGRLQFGVDYASQTRYVYVGAVFLLPLLAHTGKELPWRGLWRPALTLAFAAALFSNVLQLETAATSQVELMNVENAELQTVEYFRSAPDMNMDSPIDNRIMIWGLRAGAYLAARDALGSPVPTITPDNLARLPSWAVDRVMVNLFGDRLIAASTGPDSGNLPCRTVDSGSASTLEFRVPANETVKLQTSRSGNAVLSLGFLKAPSPKSLKVIDFQAAQPLWLHVPNTGKPTVWQLWVRTSDLGLINACSELAPQVTRLSQYGDAPASYVFGPGWSYAPDYAANGNWALRASAGTPQPEGAFGDSFTPTHGSYDIWFRVRVANNSGQTPEMLLTLVDVDANRYVASSTFRPNEVTTGYQWLLVGTNVTPEENHQMRFQTNITARLSTDWYVDAVSMVPAGSGPVSG
jgi:hypothetical protein